MKKILVFMGVLLAFSFVLVACGNDSSNDDTSKDAVASDTKKEKTKEKKGVIDSQKYTLTWSEDWKGLKTSITDVSVVKMEKSEMESMGLTGDGLIGVKFTLENSGEMDFNTYPDQATILVDGQQIEASMVASDNIGGEILKGAKKEGVVAFEVPKLDDVNAIKQLRLKWSANYDTENYEEDFSHDYDITLDLK
ncbi:hypothetical protein [Listeria booriae]|uniref:DUF4352 domain-containing protein n=1 Tax=Listeria booriae TaxID=1552123 RepID=A0A7X1CXV3_9LIST|nr:hypothetical protein [Listeria booriae]MBC2115732.1 DUF4352 domain-containing protein [Listeria booriae]